MRRGRLDDDLDAGGSTLEHHRGAAQPPGKVLSMASPEKLARGKWAGPHDLARHEHDPARQVTGPGRPEA
jgi:hypothetical protein